MFPAVFVQQWLTALRHGGWVIGLARDGSAWQAAGGVVLWLLRLCFDVPGTVGGFRRWVPATAPVAPGTRAASLPTPPAAAALTGVKPRIRREAASITEVILLALAGSDLGAVAVPLAVQPGGGEVPLDQVRCPPAAPAWPGGGLTPALGPGHQVLLAHQRGDGVLAHPPAVVAQVGGDPRRSGVALMGVEQPLDFGGQARPPLRPRRQRPSPGMTAPFVEPGLRHPQRPAGHAVPDAAPVPLGGDEGSHRYLPIASFTQRATLRLSTSRSIASSAFSRRSRASSARSSSPSAPFPSPRRRLSAFTQLPRVPSLMPRSRATRATGFPVSPTSRTAPSRKSASNFLRVSPIRDSSPLRGSLHAGRGNQLDKAVIDVRKHLGLWVRAPAKSL